MPHSGKYYLENNMFSLESFLHIALVLFIIFIGLLALMAAVACIRHYKFMKEINQEIKEHRQGKRYDQV